MPVVDPRYPAWPTLIGTGSQAVMIGSGIMSPITDGALTGTGASSGGPVAGITSFEIVAATPLLDQTGDYGDATVRVGVNGTAWVAKVVLPDDGISTFDPTKITVNVSDSSNSGLNAPITRALVGTLLLRRQALGPVGPSSTNTLRQNSASAGVRTLFFTLSGRVFTSTTITSVVATAGFYGAAAAGTVASVTNSSAQAYWQPTCAWLNKQQDRITGTTRIELDVSSAFARNSQAVPRVVFKVKNPAGTVVDTYTVTTPTLSTVQRGGNITECYAFDMTTANIPQATADTDICTVDAEIHSWIGTAPYVLSTDGVAWPTQNAQTPLRFMCDKNGTYGGAVAPVLIGAAGVAAVYANQAAAQAGAALGNAYTTWAAAANALAAYNNTNKGHNSCHGSLIMLMETTPGGGATHVIGTTTATTHATGGCWTRTYVDPAASGTVNATFTGAATLKTLFDFDVDVIVNGGSATVAATNFPVLSYGGHTITQTTTGQITNKFCITYNNGTTFASANGFIGFGGNATDKMVGVFLGCTATANTTTRSIFPASMIGCNTGSIVFQDRNASQDDMNPYYKNNQFFKQPSACLIGTTVTYGARGATNVQNVFERAGGGVSPLAESVSEETFSVDNYIQQQNTTPGTDTASRQALIYVWKNGTQNLTKNLSSAKNNLYYDITYGKQDTNQTNSTEFGRVGNWAMTYHVDSFNNGSATGSSSIYVGDPDGVGFPGCFIQPAERWGPFTVSFVDNKSGGAAAGFGNYRLTGANTAIANMVGAADNCTKYDIVGTVRLTDGTEMPGAFSRAS